MVLVIICYCLTLCNWLAQYSLERKKKKKKKKKNPTLSFSHYFLCKYWTMAFGCSQLLLVFRHVTWPVLACVDVFICN